MACSGGGDSVALLVFLWSVRHKLGLEILVAHVNHGLRTEAEQDAELVRTFCRDLGLDLAEVWLNIKAYAEEQGLGLETAARELRWNWLKGEAASIGAKLVATGHTLDDHTETIFIRLARGGGLGSLTPLPPRQGIRWSPLIECTRDELRAYLLAKQLPWREDATNTDPFTARNRWRRLLPALREEAPALDQHLWETHAQIQELIDYRNALVATWRGVRWDLETDLSPGIRFFQGAWTQAELGWVMEAAFRELAWPREACLLRDLAHWLQPHLQRRPRKAKTWGTWQLSPETSNWLLHTKKVQSTPIR